ncbi:MAG: NUDIX domain-containing protein [Jatrophihabitans sp.]
MTDHEYRVLSSTPRFTGNVISVRTDAVQMADGSVADRDYVVHPGAVGVVALDEQDRVVVVHQFRAPVGITMDELPAGLLDVAGEPALIAAQRELYEEAALRADDWHVLVDLHTTPGGSNEAIRIYLARGLHEVPAVERYRPEGEEVTMTVRRVPLEELVTSALAGDVTNAAAVAGSLATLYARSRGWTVLRAADAPWRARPELAASAGT